VVSIPLNERAAAFLRNLGADVSDNSFELSDTGCFSLLGERGELGLLLIIAFDK
jgi:hypothetical protein